jgi:hypothetical protein
MFCYEKVKEEVLINPLSQLFQLIQLIHQLNNSTIELIHIPQRKLDPFPDFINLNDFRLHFLV